MAIYDECYTQLKAAILAWDFSPVWPQGYAGTKSVLVANMWPYDIIENMLKEGVTTPVGAMTMPIISIVTAHGTGSFRSLGGNIYVSGKPVDSVRAERFAQSFAVATWADELLGGIDTVNLIAGQIAGCVLANRNTLASYRNLRITASDPAYEDRPQLWTYDQHVEGVTVHSVSLP